MLVQPGFRVPCAGQGEIQLDLDPMWYLEDNKSPFVDQKVHFRGISRGIWPFSALRNKQSTSAERLNKIEGEFSI